MPSKKDETDTKAEVKHLLDKHKWFWFSPPANAFGKSGISDRIAIKTGAFMAIETKRGAAPPKPTVNQVAFLNSIRQENGFAFVVNDTRLTTLANFLETFDRSCEAAQKGEKPTAEDLVTMAEAIAEMTKEL